MGKGVKETISEKIAKISKHYSDFFDVEICEDFHIHWRNTRLQFDGGEFKVFCEGLASAYDFWTKIGRVDPQPSWTLPKYIYGPVKIDPVHAINRDIIKVETHEQPDYVHFHYKSLRLDLSIEEFVKIANLLSNAKKRILGTKIVHDFSLEWRAGHIFPLIFKENKEFIKGEILHIGCNSGTTTYFLSNYGYAVGIDINREALNTARKLFEKHDKNGLFIYSDVENMEFADDSFDCCVIFEVLEHLFDPEPALKEIKRVVKNGGYVLISVPRADYNNQTDIKSKTRAFDPEHKRFYTNIEQLKEELKNFEIVKTWHETRSNPARPNEFHDNFFAVVKVVK